MEEKTHENRITVLEVQCKDVKTAVTNHIPTQIKTLGISVCELKKAFNEHRISQAKTFSEYQVNQARWTIGIFVSIVMLLLAVIVSIVV